MPGACLSLWLSEQSQWRIIAEIWRWSDLLQRAIYISLTLMLLYTLLVVIRFFRIRGREFRALGPESGADFHRNRRTFSAQLTRGLETLRGIAYTAPILALAGTSYGILAAASSFGYGHRTIGSSFINFISQDFAATLINTAIGILAAVLATLSHNWLRTRAEALAEKLLSRRNSHECNSRSFQYAQTLPLKKQLSGPPYFALLAAAVLAFPAMAYVVFRPYPAPTGLSVRLLPMGPVEGGDHLTQPLVVAVLDRPDDWPVIRVNSEEIPFDKLEEVVSQKLQGRSVREAYVEGDSSARFAYVAEAIDRIRRLRCGVFLITTQPARGADCGDPRFTKHSRKPKHSRCRP